MTVSSLSESYNQGINLDHESMTVSSLSESYNQANS
jgi:hypothetical protein